MKANNLAISIPSEGCNKNCPYCISKMTESVENDFDKMMRNTEKVEKLADKADVTNVLLTGKTEPLMDFNKVEYFLNAFSDFPIELQTNGIALLEYPIIMERLFLDNLNVAAFSIDKIEDFERFKNVFIRLKGLKILIRVTVNVSSMLNIDNTPIFETLIQKCKEHKIDQLTLRKLSIPLDPKDDSAAKWIQDHYCEELYTQLYEDAMHAIRKSKHIRSTNYGTHIYDIGGIAFSYSDYCIQERSGDDDIRSLIFMNDGHVYTSWDSTASAFI